jgi:acyl carrier protein
MNDKQQDLLALFRQVAQSVDKKKFDQIALEAEIGSLGIDSLSMMQIVGEMEQKLDIMIPDEDLVQLKTVGDLLRVVEKRLG